MAETTGGLLILSIFGAAMGYCAYQIIQKPHGADNREEFTNESKNAYKYSVEQYGGMKDVWKDFLQYQDVPCNIRYNRADRYMYQPVPPATNSSYDIRDNYFTPPADNSDMA